MISLTYDDNGLSVNLSKAPQVGMLQLQKWMTLVVAHLHAAVLANIGEGGLIGRRTGMLARAIKELIKVEDNGVVGEVWPDPSIVDYGVIQEEGGTILPKKQFLAIPLEAMETGNGVARGTAQQVKDAPGAFGFSGTFIAKGVIFGVEGKGKRESIVPLFALKTSVLLPGRHYLSTTFTQELTWIMDLLEKITAETVQLTFGDVTA